MNSQAEEQLKAQVALGEEQIVAGQLSAELTPGTLAELRDTAQVDPEAYNLYLQGRQIARSEEPKPLKI